MNGFQVIIKKHSVSFFFWPWLLLESWLEFNLEQLSLSMFCKNIACLAVAMEMSLP